MERIPNWESQKYAFYVQTPHAAAGVLRTWLEKHTNALCQSVLASQRPVCDETFEAVRYIAVSLSEPSLESWR